MEHKATLRDKVVTPSKGPKPRRQFKRERNDEGISLVSPVLPLQPSIGCLSQMVHPAYACRLQVVNEWQDLSVKLLDRYAHRLFLSVPEDRANVSYGPHST